MGGKRERERERGGEGEGEEEVAQWSGTLVTTQCIPVLPTANQQHAPPPLVGPAGHTLVELAAA